MEIMTLMFLKTCLQKYLSKNMKKKIYVPMGADIIHEAHLNIIKKAQQYGDVIIGLFSV